MRSTLLVLALASLCYFVAAEPAQCSWCGSLSCWDSGDCYDGCACVGDGSRGFCAPVVE